MDLYRSDQPACSISLHYCLSSSQVSPASHIKVWLVQIMQARGDHENQGNQLEVWNAEISSLKEEVKFLKQQLEVRSAVYLDTLFTILVNNISPPL